MRIGEIWLVNLDPTVGDEIRKTRPVVILNGGDAKYLALSIVVPITAWQPRWEGNPFFVTLNPDSSNGLSKRSVIDCFQIRTLSHRRFIRRLGELGEGEVDAVKTATALILDIEPEHC